DVRLSLTVVDEDKADRAGRLCLRRLGRQRAQAAGGERDLPLERVLRELAVRGRDVLRGAAEEGVDRLAVGTGDRTHVGDRLRGRDPGLRAGRVGGPPEGDA